MSDQFSHPTTTAAVQAVCVNHPDRPTNLRCNRCGDPICPQCAVLTPTGYRCKKCVRGQQKVFDTAQTIDYPVAIVIAAVLGFLGSFVASFLGFFTIFIAPVAGVIVAEAVRAAVRRRRARGLFIAAAAAAAAGGLPLLLLPLLQILVGVSAGSGGMALGGLLPLVWRGLYVFLVASTAYYRLSGIQMGR
jgi:hypothetical protein